LREDGVGIEEAQVQKKNLGHPADESEKLADVKFSHYTMGLVGKRL
jgi:hypothetical protein